uniref:NADH dehydrogenase subunit 2 n=1 Tax=Phthiridium szechuanum TaxID=2982585 RepID=UPI002238BA31|nr:NADH dehydrogenase subunit 2 [Phthiridium szechuanum]UYP50975.1 NADH dehydrogenase subunit 2 [Phthiridium szechuanum]
MNYMKLLFMFMLIFSSLISISSNSWFSMWIGLEMNLMSFIPLMSDNKLMSSESSIKYFMIQTLSSLILLFSFILMLFYFEEMYKILMMISLLLKMGAAPFHFWFPSVMEGLSWTNSFILMTWQKLTPMILISYIMNYKFIIYFIIFSAMISSFMGMNQNSLRKLLAFSSINHLSWMISSLLISNLMMLLYFIMYSLMTFSIISYFNMFNISYMNQLYSTFFFNKYFKLFIIFNFFSYGGLPPFLGFFPKWLIIQNLCFMNMYFLVMIMIFSSLIYLYLYIKLTFNLIMFNYIENNWIIYKNINYNFFTLMIFSSLFNLWMIFIFPSMYLFL